MHAGEKSVPRVATKDAARDIISGVALTGFVFAISIYIPIAGFFSALFIPLPVVFYRIKLGRNVGSIVPSITATLMLLAIGRFSTDLWFFIELLLMGFVMGELLERRYPIEKTVLYTSAAVLGSTLLALFFYSAASHTGITALVSDYVSKNLRLTLKMYRNMGVSQENIDLIAKSLGHIQYYLVRLLPCIMAVSTLFAVWANLLLARSLLKTKAPLAVDFGPLNHWKAPEHLVWAVIACGALLLVAPGAARLIGLNGLAILMMIYFFQGLAIVAFFFEKKHFPRMFRIFLYTLIALQQMLLLIIIVVGLFDTWFNFRKIDTIAADKTD